MILMLTSRWAHPAGKPRNLKKKNKTTKSTKMQFLMMLVVFEKKEILCIGTQFKFSSSSLFCLSLRWKKGA